MVVFFPKEARFAVVTALHNMQGFAIKDNTGTTGYQYARVDPMRDALASQVKVKTIGPVTRGISQHSGIESHKAVPKWLLELTGYRVPCLLGPANETHVLPKHGPIGQFFNNLICLDRDLDPTCVVTSGYVIDHLAARRIAEEGTGLVSTTARAFFDCVRYF